ncbi:DUF2752 domain-containing protein [Pedobacter terrae]|uniref:DUF2752 domain-containing protein n=1 Tax=Pedobacter terrae TaxID=405671 RepID=UPI003FA6D23B
MKILLYISAGIILSSLAIVYYKYDPEMYSFFPECPFHKYLQLDCPGCGSQRAVHSLLNLHFYQAMDYNLLLVLSLPLLTLQLLTKIYQKITGFGNGLRFWYHPKTPVIIATIVFLFWIMRNLPIMPFKFLAA